MNKREREEMQNPNFDIESKYSDMIKVACRIISNHIEKNSECEGPIEVCLAYDVKNYMQKLIDERDRYKKFFEQALDDLSGYCGTCAYRNDCAKHDNNGDGTFTWWHDCDDWKWRQFDEEWFAEKGENPDE